MRRGGYVGEILLQFTILRMQGNEPPPKSICGVKDQTGVDSTDGLARKQETSKTRSIYYSRIITRDGLFSPFIMLSGLIVDLII